MGRQLECYSGSLFLKDFLPGTVSHIPTENMQEAETGAVEVEAVQRLGSLVGPWNISGQSPASPVACSCWSWGPFSPGGKEEWERSCVEATPAAYLWVHRHQGEVKQVRVIWTWATRESARRGHGPGGGGTWDPPSGLLILGVDAVPQRPGRRLFPPAGALVLLIIQQHSHHHCSSQRDSQLSHLSFRQRQHLEPTAAPGAWSCLGLGLLRTDWM